MRGEEEEIETPDASVRWREGFRRHEATRGLLERHSGLPRTADVKDVAWDLGVSQATLYRLIKVEALISKCIREVYLTPNRPTLKRLTDEVHAKCAAADFRCRIAGPFAPVC